ncbi:MULTISPECIES: response regulator [Roseivirga]|uniref:response regulator n=1 Tax=Roseivirga TaxID=290180 RepID=UPI001675AAEE|nr:MULTISPECIES: response regulator [Roseivirga]MEC7755389.1 response regulator [Bacteroidota bacterium]
MKKNNRMETILIVEHSYMMRLFLINYLSKNFDVNAVETPTEALEYLEKNLRPAAILSNFHSNASREREGFQQMIATLEQNNIPLIVLTDQDKSDQRIEALKLGAKDTMSKPFNPVEMQLRLMTAMGFKQKDKMKRVA